MKTCIFLITLLGFIKVVFCGNLTELIEDESNQQCPVSLFRSKRDQREYTRWRTNMETTPEFIVKVLDDESTTQNSNQIVAVNILPVTKRGEKIIVGGAMVPPPSSGVPSADLLREYTRFVPPTTVAVTKLAEDLYLAQQPQPLVAKEGPPPIRPPTPSPLIEAPPKYVRPSANALNPRRDESPPASPQFIARYPTVLARQYAPIAPVAFTRRISASPLTPPSYKTDVPSPQRSTYPGKMDYPVRSSQAGISYQNSQYDDTEEYRRTSSLIQYISPVNEKDHEVHLSRTVFSTIAPIRTKPQTLKTTGTTAFEDENFERYSYTKPTFESDTPKDEEKKDFNVESPEKLDYKVFPNKGDGQDKIRGEKQDMDGRKNVDNDGKDTDPSIYSNFFYNDDYKDVPVKKQPDTSHLKVDEYDDKSKDKDDIAVRKDIERVDHNDVNDLDGNGTNEVYADNADIQAQTVAPILKNHSIRATARTWPIRTQFLTEKTSTQSMKEVKKPTCSMIKLRKLNFNSPRTLPEIIAQLKQWAEDSPVAKWVDITDGNYTTMENPIYMMIVDDPSSGQIMSAKQTVMVVAGIQGRDHHAVAAAMYLLYQLIERNEAHADLLTKYRFWVIPVFNPDGFDYSMTFPHKREWTKNLRQTWDNCKGRESCKACETFGLRCTIQTCYGVNLDRNFEYQWIPTEELKAEHPCGLLYAGERQLSEAETRALTQYLHDQRSPIYTFIAYKEGDVLGVMYPYSHTRKKRAFDHVYRQRASRAASAAYVISGRPYVAGQTSEFLPLYAGGIEDWMDSHVGIDNTYTIMMFRPTDSYNSKLITERVVHETYAATDTLLMQSSETLNQPSVTLTRAKSSRTLPSAILVTIMVACPPVLELILQLICTRSRHFA